MEALQAMQQVFPWCKYDYEVIHNQTCDFWDNYLKHFIKDDAPKDTIFEKVKDALGKIARHHCNLHYYHAKKILEHIGEPENNFPGRKIRT